MHTSWSDKTISLVLFKSKWILNVFFNPKWFYFFLIHYSISIEEQKIIWTQNNFPPCFSLLFKSQGIWLIFLINRITENNMNTKQFSFLFVLVLFKSQVILLVLSKSQGIWSVERNGLVLFKSQGSWWFLIIYYSISIEWQKIIWTQNNFPPCFLTSF